MVKRARIAVMLAALTAGVGACSPAVWMGAHSEDVFEELPDTAVVRRIDARGMPRPALQRIVEDHRILARFHARLPSGERRAAELDSKLAEAEIVARAAGADALLYLDESAVMGAIMQDARYAGPPGATVIYVMRSRSRR